MSKKASDRQESAGTIDTGWQTKENTENRKKIRIGNVKMLERLPLSDTPVDSSTGLTEEQAAERVRKGHVNNVKIGTTNTVLNIIVTNAFTFFNILCFAVFAWIMSAAEGWNDFKNCSFMVIITLNICLGIFQEIRAKRVMDKMSLLSSPKAIVLRGGNAVKIELNQILRDDIMTLTSGAQICSDCRIVFGEAEVNESMLTGESKPIKKQVGDTLLSGSFIVSGKCTARVTAIGEENYIQKLAIEAKKFKKQKSELMHSLNLIMKFLVIIIIIMAVPSFINNFTASLGGSWGSLGHLGSFSKAALALAYKNAVTTTSTALIGMIPAGLFLLTSTALSVGVIRLSHKKALVQGIYSIETLARVNMLCLDKTGTITDGTMNVTQVIKLGRSTEEKIGEIVSSMQRVTEDTNQTAKALKAYFGTEGGLQKQFTIPFSSERKCSAVKFIGEKMYVIGAPEYVCTTISQAVQKKIDYYSKEGNRCLLLAASDEQKAVSKQQIPTKTAPVALIVIEDNIKSEAASTIKYFQNNGVSVRVISGDNPITVSQIAKRVGIERAERYLSLQDMPDDEIRAAALDYTVFGRVSPEQKKLLVQIFKEDGNTVAMTGDGINDILALKEADCSIAMANGCEATRNVAQLVLMDSNFASMPAVVAEGRRVVNNIERGSTLFLMKTMFTFLLQIILFIMQEPFPLLPIQMSFINFFAIGAPAFFLAFEPNNHKIQGRFIPNIIRKVLPSALAMVLNTVLLMVLDKEQLIIITEAQLRTLVMVSVYTVFLLVLFDICHPFNMGRVFLYGTILVSSMLIIFLSPLVESSVLNLFDIASLYKLDLVTLVVSLVFLANIIIRLSRFTMKCIDRWRASVKQNGLFSFVKKRPLH